MTIQAPIPYEPGPHPEKAGQQTRTRSWARAVGVLVFSMVAAIPNPANAGEPEAVGPKQHVQISAIADVASVAPGETFLLGLRFDIDPKWHIYWPGQNDSGLPPTWELTLPEGFTAGPTRWPAPIRHVSPGDILDHVYEQSVTVLIPVTTPSDPGILTKVGASFKATFDARWLVCDQVCLPESGAASLTLGFNDAKSAPSKDSARIRTVAERIPKPQSHLPEGVTIKFSGRTMHVEAKDAGKLEWYPSELSVAFVRLLEVGSVVGGELKADFELKSASTGEPVTEPKIDGVLAVFPKVDSNGRSVPAYYQVSYPPIAIPDPKAGGVVGAGSK